jgi:hypothetical protein
MPGSSLYKATIYQRVRSLIGVHSFLRQQGATPEQIAVALARLQAGVHKYAEVTVGERTIRIEQVLTRVI